MENKINIAELLKDCPEGMDLDLDCAMYDNVQFDIVQDGNAFPIKINTPEGRISLSKYGCYSLNPQCKCVIFPKGKTTWEGFQRPFKDGDIVALDTEIGVQLFIFKEYIDAERDYVHCYMMLDDDGTVDLECGDFYVERFATEEEKQKLFDAIKANGYKWNEETKTLEKLIESCKEDIEETIIDTIKESADRYRIKVNYQFDIEVDEGEYYVVRRKPQYPKTYEECAQILLERASVRNDIGYKGDLLIALQQLLVCRDAYWKIAGEERGLGEPWKPTDDESSHMKYVIQTTRSEISGLDTWCETKNILELPTAEMRDVFYENFYELIKRCRELL